MTGASFGLFHVVLQGDLAISKTKGTFLWNSGLGISLRHLDCRECRRLISTDDCCQFITLSPCLCTQRDWRNAARRAGPSVTAETCHHRHCHHRKLPTAPIHFLARHDNEKAIAPQIQAMRLTIVRVIKCLYHLYVLICYVCM